MFRLSLHHAVVLTGGIALASCGGGDGMVASTPPVATTSATPASPTVPSSDVSKSMLNGYTVLTEGTRPALAIALRRAEGSRTENTFGPETFEFLDGAAVRLKVGANRTYTIEFAAAGLPASQSFDLAHETHLTVGGLNVISDFGRKVVQTFHYSDGSTKTVETLGLAGDSTIPIHLTAPGVAEGTSLRLYLGDPDVAGQDLHYLALGSWSRNTYEPAGSGFTNNRYSPGDTVYFVTGQRTESGQLPTTGTANYTARVDGGQSSTVQLGTAIRVDTVKLVADFGAQNISAAIDVPYEPDNDCCGATLGIAAEGRGPIAPSGDYRIALSGTSNTGSSTGAGRIGGSLQGAFFGPVAEDTGGVIELRLNDVPVFAGNFGGTRTAP